MDSWMTIFVPANRCEQSRRRELQKQPKSRGGVKPRRSSCRIYALNRPAGRNHARCEPSWTLLRAAGNNTGLYQEKTGEHLSRRDVQRASGGFQHLSMDAETSSWRTQMCLREHSSEIPAPGRLLEPLPGPWVDSGFLDLLQEPEQGSSAPRAKMEFSVICASRLHFFRLTLSHCVGWKEGFHVSAHLLWDYEEAA
uniref:uncharacterized protein LOC118551966 isoform X4 n=1 Tax=Halichoerus grypus TaxID=9711 RepID=UPI001659A0C7|nr:uncharacterized protein LOC118551966 isoform X4 [Halichoerus grypus]